MKGPSSNLPAGQDLCDLSVNLATDRVYVSISDRRDFYHQLWVTRARAIANTVGPGLPADLVKKTSAYQQFLLQESQRLVDQDASLLWACFDSILQGDHAGVEIATDAHTQLLQSYGLLSEDVQLIASRPCYDDSAVQGLVIDDFFSVSIDPIGTAPCESRSYKAYVTAQKAFADNEILGSPEEDIVAENEGKTIGAFINCSPSAVAEGLYTVGAPAKKRLSLSFLTLQLCALPYTTASLHRCHVGAWVSILLYRRPMMGLLNEAFMQVDSTTELQDSALVPLPRKVAQELVLCAVLAPMMMSDIAVEVDEMMYATDASESRGAVCSAFLGQELVRMLSRTCRTKGAYTRLNQENSELPPTLDSSDSDDDSPGHGDCRGPSRLLAYSFGFIEIYAGSSRITQAIAPLQVSVGPPLYPRNTSLSWIYYLLESGRLLAVAVEPPCTSFSIMRRPALRSRLVPYDFNLRDPQTRLGNLLFLRGLQIMKKASLHGAAGLLERPFTALSKFLPSYQAALSWDGACEERFDSCQFGSIHQKSLAMLGINLDLQSVARRCKGLWNHVPVQGVYTKASTIYTPELAHTLAWTLKHSIKLIKNYRADDVTCKVVGLENQLVNELMLTGQWAVKKAWKFKQVAHINILELKAVERLVEDRAKSGPCTFLNFVDSNVTRCALVGQPLQLSLQCCEGLRPL